MPPAVAAAAARQRVESSHRADCDHCSTQGSTSATNAAPFHLIRNATIRLCATSWSQVPVIKLTGVMPHMQ